MPPCTEAVCHRTHCAHGGGVPRHVLRRGWGQCNQRPRVTATNAEAASPALLTLAPLLSVSINRGRFPGTTLHPNNGV